jgi:hypothetical protein
MTIYATSDAENSEFPLSAKINAPRKTKTGSLVKSFPHLRAAPVPLAGGGAVAI